MPKAPPLVINNAVQLRISAVVSNTTAMTNIIGAIKTGTLTVDQALANTLATGVASAWITNMGPRCPSSTILFVLGVRDLSSPSLTEFVAPTTGAGGTAVADDLPGGDSCVVTLRTALSGHRYRGRVYVGGFSELENTAGGAISTAAQTGAAGFISAIDTLLQAHTMRLAVISRPAYAQSFTKTWTNPDGTVQTETHTRPARPGAVTQVTSVAVRNSIWDSQRHRNGLGSGSTLFGLPNVLHQL